MTEREALQLASGIVRQHNLCSTPSESERMATINRLLDWLNYIVYPVLDPADELPEFMTEDRNRVIEDLRRFAKVDMAKLVA